LSSSTVFFAKYYLRIQVVSFECPTVIQHHLIETISS